MIQKQFKRFYALKSPEVCKYIACDEIKKTYFALNEVT